jgi:hypothetical protein
VPRLNPNVRSALPDWWNLATDAAQARLGSSVLLEAASDLANQAGRSLTFGESSALTTLYGYASRIRNAGEAARAASDETYIGPEHVAIPPWARVESEQNANRIWHVRYHFTSANSNGVLSTEYKTSVFQQGQIPDTIGRLKAEIEADAEVLAAKYNVNLVSVDLHQILEV